MSPIRTVLQDHPRSLGIVLIVGALALVGIATIVGAAVLRQPESLAQSSSPASPGLPSASSAPSATVGPSHPAASQAALPSAADEPAGEPPAMLRVQTAGLRLRTQPSTTANVVRTLTAGASVRVVGGPERVDGFDWYEVANGEDVGWVAAGEDGEWLAVVLSLAICESVRLAEDGTLTVSVGERQWAFAVDHVFDDGGALPIGETVAPGLDIRNFKDDVRHLVEMAVWVHPGCPWDR